MTGINAWIEMEHKDHELGVSCLICEGEAETDFRRSVRHPDHDYDYSEDSRP